MAADNGLKAVLFGEIHGITREFHSIEPVERLQPTCQMGYIHWLQAQFYQDKLNQFEVSDKMLNPLFGFINLVTMSDY
jgi:hypothetical protein